MNPVVCFLPLKADCRRLYCLLLFIDERDQAVFTIERPAALLVVATVLRLWLLLLLWPDLPATVLYRFCTRVNRLFRLWLLLLILQLFAGLFGEHHFYETAP